MRRKKLLRKNVNDELKRRKGGKFCRNCNFKLIYKTKRISLFQYKVLPLYCVEIRECMFKHQANFQLKKDKKKTVSLITV